MNILGVRTNCQMMHVMSGTWSGLLSGFFLMAQIYFAPASTDLLLAALALGLLSHIFNCAFFGILFRYSFGGLFSTLFLGAMLTGIITLYMAMLINSPIAQPLVMMLIGSILGSVFGRLFCKKCEYSTQTEG